MENPHCSESPNAEKIALRARLPSASLRPAFGRLMMTRQRRGLRRYRAATRLRVQTVPTDSITPNSHPGAAWRSAKGLAERGSSQPHRLRPNRTTEPTARTVEGLNARKGEATQSLVHGKATGTPERLQELRKGRVRPMFTLAPKAASQERTGGRFLALLRMAH